MNVELTDSRSLYGSLVKLRLRLRSAAVSLAAGLLRLLLGLPVEHPQMLRRRLTAHDGVDRYEMFERAFETSSSGCRRRCACGMEFFNSDGGWDFEAGELEDLTKMQREGKASDVTYAVGTIMFEGREYVSDCRCWHERAVKIMDFILTHGDEIVKFLEAERLRKFDVAKRSPSMRPHPQDVIQCMDRQFGPGGS